jgi:hypothetical protein
MILIIPAPAIADIITGVEQMPAAVILEVAVATAGAADLTVDILAVVETVAVSLTSLRLPMDTRSGRAVQADDSRSTSLSPDPSARHARRETTPVFRSCAVRC